MYVSLCTMYDPLPKILFLLWRCITFKALMQRGDKKFKRSLRKPIRNYEAIISRSLNSVRLISHYWYWLFSSSKAKKEKKNWKHELLKYHKLLFNTFFYMRSLFRLHSINVFSSQWNNNFEEITNNISF